MNLENPTPDRFLLAATQEVYQVPMCAKEAYRTVRDLGIDTWERKEVVKAAAGLLYYLSNAYRGQ